MGFLQKCQYISYMLFPKFWKKRYAKRSIKRDATSAMNYINMDGVCVEWWNYRANLGDALPTVVTEHMLRQKFGTVTVQKKPAGGVLSTSIPSVLS